MPSQLLWKMNIRIYFKSLTLGNHQDNEERICWVILNLKKSLYKDIQTTPKYLTFRSKRGRMKMFLLVRESKQSQIYSIILSSNQNANILLWNLTYPY